MDFDYMDYDLDLY